MRARNTAARKRGSLVDVARWRMEMSEHEMSDAERKALSETNRALNRWMNEKLSRDLDDEMYAHGRKRHDYIYWEAPDQRMFCYTPWKDENGDYWTWVMKPFGKGARSGKATRWKQVGKKVRSRKRKTARKRAYTRYQNWLAYLRQDWMKKEKTT